MHGISKGNLNWMTKYRCNQEKLSKTKQEIRDNPEFSYEYTLEAGILFKGQQVIIPKLLQKPVYWHYKDE
jgi:hypothetical protein